MKRLFLLLITLLIMPSILLAELDITIVITTAIENREPVDTKEKFKLSDEKIFAWTHVVGATEPMDIMHVWKHEDVVVSTVILPIRSSNYRTWSHKSLHGLAGDWILEVQALDGQSLKSQSFHVKK